MANVRTIVTISRTYKHLDRYRRILGILLKNGFGFVFKDVKIHKPSGLRNLDRQALSGNLAECLRQTLTELGPTFVKLGQLLASRPDILPPNFIAELNRLNDSVPPFPIEDVRSTIRQELHGEIEDFYAEFDPVPKGCASIAQGHRAVLKDGTQVFVKIQRPNIRNDIEVDLEVLSYLASKLEEDSIIGFLHPSKIIDEFAEALLGELNFNNEIANMLSFGRQSIGNDCVCVPRPYKHLCTSRMITMDYVDGVKCTEIELLRQRGYDLNAIAENGAKLFFDQCFKYGFFHGDPHPGNIFVLPGNKLCYIDFGVMGRITQDERKNFARLLTCMVSKNNKIAAKLILRLANTEQYIDLDNLERQIANLMDVHFSGDLNDLKVVDAIRDFYALCYKERISLKPHIYLLLKSLCYVESIGRQLKPDFAIMGELKPMIQRQYLAFFNPIAIGKDLLDIYLDWEKLFLNLPQQIKYHLEQVIAGKHQIHCVLDDVPDKLHNLSKSVDRLALALLSGSLIVASALLFHGSVPPLYHGMSALGLTFAALGLGGTALLAILCLF